ncbi:DUF2334 domain-containing protein [uncultured Sphingomonas sp.]|uniref:DUF2334 domain-containing protein n=1 Tax=uncultured Sphingomonas sp. TaxID=158754 RepID=UPI0035CB5555
MSPRLLLSIHDVSPRFETAIDRLHDLLTAAGGQRIAMLVVPDFWREAPIRPGSRFATRLRDWAEAGVEMFLHGSVHRDETPHRSAFARFKARHLTAGEGEFLGLDATAAAARIAAGRALIEEVCGRSIAGFVAPAWLYGPGTHRAMAAQGIAIAEDHWKVWRPTDDAVLARSPVITWATRTPARERSSLAVAALARRLPGPRVMRVAVHPGDCGSDPVRRSITATVAALARQRVGSRYADLVHDFAPAPPAPVTPSFSPSLRADH